MTHPVFSVLAATCPSRTSQARIANKWTAMVVIALSSSDRGSWAEDHIQEVFAARETYDARD